MMTEVQILAQLKRKYDAEMVSALVGAGFTKNVYSKAHDWTGLLKDLVEKAYEGELEEMYRQYMHLRFGVDIKPYEECKDEFIGRIINRDGYLDVVSKYIEVMGFREAIDYYIETHNPFFYKISEGKYGVKGDDETVLTAKDFTVHQRFLLGKWQYVFTTNFDNALEFTDEQFVKRYTTIKADYEMSRKKMARPIVKIHGSLVPPDKSMEMPYAFDGDHSGRYIISRDDFDNYFTRHEAFSYLLRVAMLSGSYCLLGFSGDDPNFKSWLNWVKDILDKDTSSINNDNKDAGSGEKLVKDDEKDIKVFLILTNNDPLTEAQKLYYRNHHIGVIHLDNPEIRVRLGYSDLAPTSHKVDRLLKYIIGSQKDGSGELQADDIKRPSLAKAWKELYNKLDGKEPITDELRNLRATKEENKYTRSTQIQDFVIDEILRKKELLTDDDKEVLLDAISDVGIPTECLPKDIREQLETVVGWEAIKQHENSLEGDDSELRGNSDFSAMENVLRALYHFNFSKAKKLLNDWQAGNGFSTQKASLNHYWNRQDSLKTLDAVIMNSQSDVELYVASFVYNCIDNGFIAPYPLNEYKSKGLIGLNDVLKAIVEELKDKKKDLNSYGTEVVYYGKDDRSPDAPAVKASYRFLCLISNEGFNLCYGITNIINVSDWYEVFRRLYTSFPLACLFYSCQYNNKKVLRRIGQDYAFEEELREQLPTFLLQIFEALNNQDTPGSMMSGILQVGSQLFWGIKEELWFDDFYKYLSTTFAEEEGKYLYSSDSKIFVKNAIVCLHEKDNIRKVVTVLLNLFEKMPDDVIDMLYHYVRLNKLDVLDDEQNSIIEKIVATATMNKVAPLLSIIDEKKFLDEELRENFVNACLANIEEVKKSDRYTLFNLCCLAENMPEAVGQLKKVILERNIWDCGVGKDWIVEAQPFYLMHLGEPFMLWSLEEVVQITENLKFNLKKLTKKNIQEAFLNNQYTKLLIEMKSFTEKFCVDDEVKKDIDEKLAIARHYDSIENGLYSDNPETVETATKELNPKFREGKFEENSHLFGVLINKCTMKSPPALSECLVTIALAVHFCGEEIKKDDALLRALYRLLLQYKNKDLRDLDLQIIHAAHSLLVIAEMLSTTELNDENITYWLNNKNLTRLNYLEF